MQDFRLLEETRKIIESLYNRYDAFVWSPTTSWAIDMLSSGILSVPAANGGRAYNAKPITTSDVRLAGEQPLST